MLLFIDTTDYTQARVAVITSDTVKEKTWALAYNQSYKLSPAIIKFIGRTKPTKTIVCTGPGSFTGIRVGASIALALGLAWPMPIIGITKNQIPEDLKKLLSYKGSRRLALRYE
jgi:tRNA threonylcarbamoyladenosine biosynthesis protein TsaB